jgi:dTDP-glucose 4,6-dehydratase
MSVDYLITGVAGFIGGHLAERLVDLDRGSVLGIDHLGYASDAKTVESSVARGMAFEKVDITDSVNISRLLERAKPRYVLHLAAESHVDRSIDSGLPFIESNVIGTVNILDALRKSSSGIGLEKFIHVSTDEVFGEAAPEDAFDEMTRYDPHSPYAASKAAADHVARSWGRTYGLPITVTNCTNNYGPRQFPEKLIPHTIIRALSGMPIPIYGDGSHERDWMHVTDHVEGLLAAVHRGQTHKTYLFGARQVTSNLELVQKICAILDEIAGNDTSFADLIEKVADRPGHDMRYAINPYWAESSLQWKARQGFQSGLRETVAWYVDNRWWWEPKIDVETYNLSRIGLT